MGPKVFYNCRLVSRLWNLRPRAFHHEAHLCKFELDKITEIYHKHTQKMSETGDHLVKTETGAVQETTEKLQNLGLKEKKPKQRKAQTEEEYLEQKTQFEKSGPQINSDDWLLEEERLSDLDSEKKLDRVHILHACEKAYFMQDYQKCIELIKKGERLFGVELDDETANDDLKSDFQNAGRKTRKSTKVERHVVELLHIKESCLKKLGDV